MKFSDKVREKIEKERAHKQITVTKDWFIHRMVTMHQIMRSSVPLMQAAESMCGVDGDAKPEEKALHKALEEYYHKHIEEERHHDEWLLDDLESIGLKRWEVLAKEPPDTVAEFVGTQYYWIYHFHPVILMGYIAFLEGNPPTKEGVQVLKAATGYPDTAFRIIEKHGVLDIKHKEDLDNTLDSLPLQNYHKDMIVKNAVFSTKRFNQVCECG